MFAWSVLCPNTVTEVAQTIVLPIGCLQRRQEAPRNWTLHPNLRHPNNLLNMSLLATSPLIFLQTTKDACPMPHVAQYLFISKLSPKHSHLPRLPKSVPPQLAPLHPTIQTSPVEQISQQAPAPCSVTQIPVHEVCSNV
jgi:hypothetical protein